jgi:XTP/dITP diphosphohydrolase
MKKEIIFVTGNKYKLAAARIAFAKYGIKLKHVDMDTPEIQADDVAEIVAYSAKWAAAKLRKPVMVNDASWSITTLNGFPGPYMRHVSSAIGTQGFFKLMRGMRNREMIFKEAVAYCEPGKKPIIVTGIIKGRLATRISTGEHSRWAIDHIFIPPGYSKPLSRLTDEERSRQFAALRTWDKMARKILIGK